MFPFPHLLGVADLDATHIETILARADHFADLNAAHERVERTLSDRTLINLFFESSTRTQASFELAAKRLGATVMNMSVKTSSVNKGETLVDTAATLNAMLPDILVVRHQDSGAVELLANKVNCAVVNAGDGWHEHPTQALLDALTIRRAFRERRGDGKLTGLTITICGDALHSRVARSNIFLHRLLGNEVRVVAPPTLTPPGLESLGVTVEQSLAKGVKGADVVMMLRLQRERMDGAFIPSLREYFHRYGLDFEELAFAKSDALVMHPGPMNRGVEIDSELADDPERSLISTQVEMGVAVRMAVLELVAANLPHRAEKSERKGGGAGRPHFVAATVKAPERTGLHNALLIDPESGRETVGDIVIDDGVIADIGVGLLDEAAPTAIHLIDCAGACVAPGLVDMCVYVGEPGERHKESFGSGGEAAVAGGVTTIVTQPNTNPPVDDPSHLDFIAQRIREEAVDHAMPNVLSMAALTQGLEGRKMTEYEFLISAGALGLTDGYKAVADPLVFRRCLDYAASVGALVAHHVQDPYLSAGACATEGAFATRRGLPAAPPAAETIMLKRDLALVEVTGARYHAAQVSLGASLDALERAKKSGLDVTAAVSAPHFALSEDDIRGYRTFYKTDPPLRSAADRSAMIDGLASGVIDCIVSCHRPQNEESKRVPYAAAAPGAVGLETLLAVSLDLVRAGRLSLSQLFQRLSLTPAERLGLPQGRLRKGAPADLVVFDPDLQWLVNRRRLRSKSKNSPFDRQTLTGSVLRTIVCGQTVFTNDPPAEPGADG
ncbi:MAG: aspartate carbamoyltransferase catalytic subunit [Pseudomonadota bacterium]